MECVIARDADEHVVRRNRGVQKGEESVAGGSPVAMYREHPTSEPRSCSFVRPKRHQYIRRLGSLFASRSGLTRSRTISKSRGNSRASASVRLAKSITDTPRGRAARSRP